MRHLAGGSVGEIGWHRESSLSGAVKLRCIEIHRLSESLRQGHLVEGICWVAKLGHVGYGRLRRLPVHGCQASHAFVSVLE